MESPVNDSALSELELGAWRGLLRAHSALTARLDAELREHHDLALGAYEVLISLADSPGGRLRMGELARALLLSRSGLTRLVDRLARRGLVARERCADDARGWFAVITPEGRELLREARPAHLDGVRRHFLEGLSRADLRALDGAWRKLGVDGRPAG
jgi:DNA-binding MarR family transcriptional regulator